jgi:hypothetical protein
MPCTKFIKLSLFYGAVLGVSIACSTAFAQSPTPIPNSFPTPTPNPTASPPPGVQPGGVAIPVPVLNMAQYLPGGAHEDTDLEFLLLPTIQSEYMQALNQLAVATSGAPGFGPAQVTQALGKALIYDQSLSVNNNLACATCHAPYSGFTGGSSFFNATTSADPGSVPITNSNGTTSPNERISSRRPQTYSYAPFSPVLHYNNTRMIFTVATSGICELEESAWAILLPSRRKDRRLIRWRWEIMILLPMCTNSQRVKKRHILKRFGVRDR